MKVAVRTPHTTDCTDFPTKTAEHVVALQHHHGIFLSRPHHMNVTQTERTYGLIVTPKSSGFFSLRPGICHCPPSPPPPPLLMCDSFPRVFPTQCGKSRTPPRRNHARTHTLAKKTVHNGCCSAICYDQATPSILVHLSRTRTANCKKCERDRCRFRVNRRLAPRNNISYTIFKHIFSYVRMLRTMYTYVLYSMIVVCVWMF